MTALLFGAGAATTATSALAADPAQEARVVELVNEERAAAGCGALAPDGRLAEASNLHSSDMSDRDYFSHTSPEGDTFVQRAERAGYPSPGAENIAQGHTSAEQVVDGWMGSQGHRENILDCSLRTIGVGVDHDGWYWTQVFGY
ncbi:CAP domain-containing protein [Parasphingorhabdus pacifica]